MSRQVALFVCLTAASTLRGSVQLLPALPNAASSTAMQLDAAGNIYLAGSFTPASKSVLGMTSAFVAELSADGSKLLYFTAIGGSSTDAAFGLAVGSDGSAYVTGNTNSPDFPVTAGALQPTYVEGDQNQGFLAKVNPAGSLVYSTFINGTASTQITGIGRLGGRSERGRQLERLHQPGGGWLGSDNSYRWLGAGDTGSGHRHHRGRTAFVPDTRCCRSGP